MIGWVKCTVGCHITVETLNTEGSFQGLSDKQENFTVSIAANHAFCTCKTTIIKSGLSTVLLFYTIGTLATREFPLLSGKRSWHLQ